MDILGSECALFCTSYFYDTNFQEVTANTDYSIFLDLDDQIKHTMQENEIEDCKTRKGVQIIVLS